MSCTTEVVQIKPKGFGGIAKRLSLSIRKNKLSQQQSFSKRVLYSNSFKKSRRPSTSSTSSGASSFFEEEGSTVRFATTDKRGKKVKVEVHEYERVRAEERASSWVNECDMEGSVNEIRKVVRHYAKNCPRYINTMSKLSNSCESTANTDCESVTKQFDKRTIVSLANAEARGLEHLIAPRLENTRKQVIESVIRTQAALSNVSPGKREKLLAAKYAQLAHSAKLLAKTMADGDAMVA